MRSPRLPPLGRITTGRGITSPMQNGFGEFFNSRMRDEPLNESLFFGLDHARSIIADWVAD